MNDYNPVPGDSVKLVGKANPDNVLYGKLLSVDEVSWEIFIDGAEETGDFFFLEEHWTITPWTRPVAFKPFAVVRLPEGWNIILSGDTSDLDEPAEIVSRSERQLGNMYWNGSKQDFRLDDASIATLLNYGAEILFEGVEQ